MCVQCKAEFLELTMAEMKRLSAPKLKRLLVSGPQTPLDVRVVDLFWDLELSTRKNGGPANGITALANAVRKERSNILARTVERRAVAALN